MNTKVQTLGALGWRAHVIASVHTAKSVLGRVRNCVGEQALRCEMVASFYVHQPNHSYADSCFVYIVILHVLLWLQVHCTVSGQSYPTKGLPYCIIHSLWPHSFYKIMYLYSICLVSTTCCDATISQHKHNTNIQELCTLPNTLLILLARVYKRRKESVVLRIAVYKRTLMSSKISVVARALQIMLA